jgi:hypothetical protein
MSTEFTDMATCVVLVPLVVADAVLDGELVPTEFIADTLYVYVVLAVSPVLEYAVLVVAVFAIMVDHVVPLSADLSILYPVIAEPPLLDGAVQERLICDDDTVLAANPVGDCGIVVVEPDRVVTEDVADGELVPTELIDDTL